MIHRGLTTKSHDIAPSKSAQLRLVLAAIEIERDNLSRAQSLLECLRAAMEYCTVDSKGPYYPDLVQMAAGIVRKSIDALDSIKLPSPSRDKVREEFSANEVAQLPIAAAATLLPPPVFALPRCSVLRLHRRNYSRALTREDSSRDSTAANISG